MMIKKLFNPILTVLCILTMLTACADEAVVENTTQPMNGDVTICFDMTVPGLAKATRSAVASVDTIVESLHLFLFDHRGGFTKVVEATSVTNPTYDEEKTEYTSSSTSGFGTYTATIPGNTSIIHFVANYDYKEEGFDENASLGRSENAVMAPLTTSSHLYWGRYTYKQIKDGTTAVLYRNYAKVTAKVNLDTSSESTDQVTAIDILGWTLCYEPMKASVTPFNDNVPDNPDGTPGDLLDGTPYAFTLSTPFVTLPAPKAERQMTMTTPEAVAEVLAEKESASNPIHCLFEHTEEGYGHELFAIFKLKVTQQVTDGGTKTTTRYYKIKLLEDTKKEGNTVIERTPYDIIRNHEYIITFKGIEPEGGYGYTAEDGRNEQEAIRLAMIGLPANNSTVDIEMTIPEVQSADYVLRVEGSTIRYYKDITAANTTIDDIIVYFAPLNGNTATSASDLTVSWENTTWESGTEGNIPALTLSATDQPNYYKISFTTDPFEEGDNEYKHYKYGVIRITEKKEYLLSRFVQVFIGDPITFRPLLISSDIPSRTDERLTVVLNVPDLNYLPKELYPIQLTFGSSRVDVEKNLDVEQMKVDFDKADYNNVLQYLSKNSTSGVWSTTDNGDGTWAWTTAGKAVPNTWGYKYIYTLESPEDAGIHRITLRTVTDSITDFKVLLEGKSLVTGTQVFNTRELEFKMQDEANGTNERRIMIDGAMEETRLTTAYLFKLDQTGADDITVNYTLGLYDEENRTAIPQTPSDDVILWVYYDHNQLTPPTDLTPKKDAENNWFVELTHDVSEQGAAGSITFTATDVVKDAVVFITARGTANYGDYNESYYTTDTSEDDPTLRTGYGNNDFLYTGVNAAALSYRSASAIINVLSTWSFNPATSTDGVEYKQESEVELPYGKDSLLYVRIEKPANTSGVILKLTSPTLQIQANDTYYTIKDATNGIIELKQTTGDFCYLKFLTTQYASAGELKLEAINEQTSYGNVSYKSSVPYDEATVTVTNKANTFADFKYADETDLKASPITYYEADADNKTHRTVRAVRGSRIGIRVFFPGSFQEQTKSFTFKMKSACYELHNDADYKYSGAKTDIGDGSHIITVEDNGLAYDEAKDLCYLDLVLSATTWDNEETIRFLTDATTDATDYIRFYPYNVSIISDKQNYPITVEQSLDNSSWSTITDNNYILSSASLATQGTSVYYRITLPAVGLDTEDKTFDFTIISDGLEVDNSNTNRSIDGVQKNDTIVFKGLEPSNETTKTYTLALKTSKPLESGSNITATILSGETVKPDTLNSVLNRGDIVFNKIPTSDENPFTMTNGWLYDFSTEAESDYTSGAPHFDATDSHIDYMQNGDYVTYEISNTEESYYQISFKAASHKGQISGGDVSVTASLVAEDGTEYLTYGTVDIIEGDSWSVDDGQEYSLTTNQPLPVGIYTLKITFNNTAGSTTCNMNYIKLTKTNRPQMTVDWVDANGNVLNNAYSCYVGEKIYLRMTADTDGTIPFKLELRQSTTSENPGTNNKPTEILKQIETNIPNFTVNTIGTEVGLTNVRVGDIYTICYEVKQAGYLRFKVSSSTPPGASNYYTTLFNIQEKTDVSGITPLVTVKNITFSNPQYRISGTDTWLDISNNYVSIGYGTGSLIDVRINTNGYTTDNITFNWGNSTDYSNASIVTEGSNTYAVMKNIPAYSNSVNFYNGSNSENTYSFQIATEEAKTYEMYVESSAYVYKENSNTIEASNSIISIVDTRIRTGNKTINGTSFTAYHGLKSDDADNDSGNQTVSINTTGYGKKMFLTLYATNKFKYTAANSSTVLITPTDNVFAAELEVGTTKIHRGVQDFYDANGNLYTAADDGLTQVGEVAIYYVKVSNVNTNQSE